MESHIIAFLEAIFDGKVAADVGLSVIIVMCLYALYKYVLKKIIEKLDEKPTKKEISDTISEKEKAKEAVVADIQAKLDKLIAKLDDIEDLTKSNYRESKELRRDIENIKQILNQFQGHMLYSGGRRSEDFGNRELR